MIEDAWDERLASRLTYKPLAELEAGPEAGMCQVYSDMWLIVHPEKGVLFFRLNGSRGLGSIQGNRQMELAKRFRDRTYPGAIVAHTRRIFVPIDITDYR